MARGGITFRVLFAALLLTAMAVPASARDDVAVPDGGAAADLAKAGHNFRVSRSSSDELAPALAYNSVDGEYLAVWSDRRHEDTRGSDIFGQRIAPDGELRGKAFRVSGGAAVGRDRQPSVAHNTSDNEYLVVWSDERRTDERGLEIYGQRIAADGTRLGHNIRVSGARAIRNEWRPNVAFNSTDNQFGVFWMDDRRRGTPGVDIFGQIVDASGDRVGPNFSITRTAQTSGPGDWSFRAVGPPAVAHNPGANEFMVAWPDRRDRDDHGGGQHIYGQRVSAAGDLVRTAFRISGQRFDVNLWAAVAHDADNGRYLVVWKGDEGNDYSTVFARWIDERGRRITKSFRVTDAEAFHVQAPGVARAPGGDRFLVTWGDSRILEIGDVFGQLVTINGIEGGNFQVSGRRARGAGSPAVAHDSSADLTLVVWSDSRRRKTSGEDIFGQLFSK